ncbi:hypothetical protein OSJ57_22865, partial [Sphingomonas sp. HH69]
MRRSKRYRSMKEGGLRLVGFDDGLVLGAYPLIARSYQQNDRCQRQVNKWGLSGFPCVAGHNGQQGVPLCHDAKNLPYRMSFSISFWRAALP